VCKSRVDLAFLIDGSKSIERSGRGNFARILRFVTEMVRLLPIGQSKTRIAVGLYSTRAYLIFGFKRYNGKTSILNAVRRIRFPRGGTRIGRALNLAARRIFAGRARRGRKRVLIVVTDGISQDRVDRPARYLKARKRVEVFVLGIGNRVRMRELRQIASPHRHVVRSDFRRLQRVVTSMKEKICCKYLWIFFQIYLSIISDIFKCKLNGVWHFIKQQSSDEEQILIWL